MESSLFLSKLSRLSHTGHEHRVPRILEDFGLQAAVKVSWLEIGLRRKHPCLHLQDMLKGLSDMDQVGEVFLHGHSFQEFQDFWCLFKKHRPQHPVFLEHEPLQRLDKCIPLYLHTDEGTGQKKKALLVAQLQGVLGRGSSRADDLNFTGPTFLTRLLFTVMNARLYQRKKGPLYSLLEHWARNLSECFTSGVRVKIRGKIHRLYPIVFGAKGDWVDLIKVGRLSRHFLRESPKNATPPGVCHLCCAGRAGIPWHENQLGSAWLLHPPAADDLPWRTPSPLLKIPHDNGPKFFLIDAFHTLHKGVFGDMVASSIVP